MARLRQVALSSDLFGSTAKGDLSLADITWETYSEIVRLSSRKFRRLLRHLTPALLKQLVDRRNWNSGSTISFVARKSLFITVYVIDVRGKNVTVNLSIEDIEGENAAVMDALLRDITAHTRCLDLEVKDGSLVGRVTLSSAAVVPLFPEKKEWARSEVPLAPTQSNVDAEERFIAERRSA